MPRFPFIRQLDSADCGLACIRMISKYHGKFIRNEFLLDDKIFSKQGMSIENLGLISEKYGFKNVIVKASYDLLLNHAPLPCIAHWNQKHFVVIFKVESSKVYVADPAFGITTYTKDEFNKYWATGNEESGILLLLETTPNFYTEQNNSEQGSIPTSNFYFLIKYLKPFKSKLSLISLGLLITSFAEFLFPFFTQKIIDKGIFFNNINFIYSLVTAQLLLFLSSTAIEFIRSWLFTHISSRISLHIISDFLTKLMKLPISFFNVKHTGDLIKRIDDHSKIEKFLTEGLMKSVFSFFTIIILSGILFYYNKVVFLIFIIGTLSEFCWILSFLEKIRIMEFKSFNLLAKDRNKLYELVTSMQEIKLNNLEERKKIEWQNIQTDIFKISLQKLRLNQRYEGYRIIGYLQTILITFFSAISIVHKEMSIGAMMAITLIVGRLNIPVGHIINFILDGQLAKISLERLSEIHNMSDEELEEKDKSTNLTNDLNIYIKSIQFSYDPMFSPVLHNISIKIPMGKTTAIVGTSGSGKTTLLKLLLKFYKPDQGTIEVGSQNLDDIKSSFWRSKCGTVLQDSIIFSESVSYNIVLDDVTDPVRLKQAIALANLENFIDSLPSRLNTKIGQEGIGVSQGQKQRILIARAIYKNPDFLFFDEATNALDTENERIIVKNIETFFKGKTVIVVAHRLSTVKNADNILVLDNGTICEQGTHEQLIIKKGKYYKLVINQLNLEN